MNGWMAGCNGENECYGMVWRGNGMEGLVDTKVNDFGAL